MLKRFDTVVLQLDGSPWKDRIGVPLTVASAIVDALQGASVDEEGKRALTTVEKLRWHALAERIHGSGSTPTEVSDEELALIRAYVGMTFQVGIVGFVFRNLESAEPAT